MRKQKRSILVPTMFLTIALVMFLPEICPAGSLEPIDPPGPTMKTLDQIPPTWSQKLQCDATVCPRFELVLDDYAVLDKETGLVWEKYPINMYGDWYSMKFWCIHSHTGGRDGWRLPTIYELSSLSEYCDSEPHWLPCGHPFLNLQDDYWSATTDSINTSEAWHFLPGGSSGHDPKTVQKYNWCVRGGFGVTYE
jgi:hypothetical protein